MRFLSQFFDNNDRELAKIQPLIDRTNELEADYEGLSDDEIRERIDGIRAEIAEDAAPEEPSEEELHHPRPRAPAGSRQGAPQARQRAAWQGRSTSSSPRCSPPAARP